jgi:hypothetical protein
MSGKHLIQCIGLLSLFGIIGAQARAEPILLIEIHDTGGGFNLSHVGAPIFMSFSANGGNGAPPIAKLEGSYDSDDVGMTFYATPENVEAFQAALSLPTGEYGIITSNHVAGGGDADELWRTDLPDYLRQFVPRLGVGFTGYDLTAVTQTIDRIEYQPGITITSQQEQTIRIYGQVIPEPSSVMLLILHVCVIVFRDSRMGR